MTRAFKAIVGPRGVGISSTSYNPGTGILTVNFTDTSSFQTGDLRGTSGKGISNTSYNSGTGILTITFTDSSTYQTSDLRGATGATGKGISSTSYNASTGIVTITFSDATTYQTGDLRGAAGAAGKGISSTSYSSTTGKVTITFTDSTTFQTTDLRGAAGAAGKGISSTSYNSSTGILTITFTDSTTYQTTDLRGSAGAAGKGISSTSYNAGTGILTITYTDSSTYQTGDLRGAAGANGKGITSTSYNATTGILTFTFSDSSTYQTGDLRAPNSSPLSYSFPLNETITANKIVQLLDSGKVEGIAGTAVTKKLNDWTESTFSAWAADIIVKFDEEVGNRFVATFLDNSTNYYNAIVGTVAGNTITFGSKYVIQSTTGLTHVDFSFCKSQTNRIVFIYSAPTTGYLNAIVGTINGTALSFSSATLIKNTSCAYNKIEKDPINNNVMLVHFSIGVVHYLKVISLASDVLDITGSNYTCPIQGPNYGSVKFSNITSNRFLIAINSSGGYGIIAVAGTISGTTISFGSPVTVDSRDAWFIELSFTYNADKFMIAFRDNSTQYGLATTGTLSGTTIGLGGSSTTFFTLSGVQKFNLVADRTVADKYVCSVFTYNNSFYLDILLDYGYVSALVYDYVPYAGTKTCYGIGICFNNASSNLICVASESNTTVFGRAINVVYSPGQFNHQCYTRNINSQIEFDPFNANRFIFTNVSTYVSVIVGIINADGTISLSAPCISYTYSFYSAMVQFSPWEANKFIVAGAGSYGCYALVGTITNNVPSLASFQPITGTDSNLITFALDKLTPNSMAVAFYSQDNAYAVAAIVGTSTISFGTPNYIGSYMQVCPVKSFFNPKVAGNFIFITSTTLYVSSFTVLSLTIQYKSQLNLGGAYPGNFDVDQYGDFFIVSYFNNSYPRLSYVTAFSVTNGSTLLGGTPVQFESDNSGITGNVAFDPQTPNRFFLMYTKSSVLYIREGNINNYVITLNSPEAIPVPFTPGSFNRISLATLKAGFMLYQDANLRILSGYINTTVSNINSSKIIGVLTEGGVLNDVKNVSLMGGIYNGFSGLIIGATYYVTPAGALTNTYAPRCFLLGKALSATCIQLKANF